MTDRTMFGLWMMFGTVVATLKAEGATEQQLFKSLGDALEASDKGTLPEAQTAMADFMRAIR